MSFHPSPWRGTGIEMEKTSEEARNEK